MFKVKNKDTRTKSLYPLKTSENPRFFNAQRGYGYGVVSANCEHI